MASSLASLMILVLGWIATNRGAATSQDLCTIRDCSPELPIAQTMDDDEDHLMLLHTSVQRMNALSVDSDSQVANVTSQEQKLRSIGEDKEAGRFHAERTPKVRIGKKNFTRTAAATKSAAEMQTREGSSKAPEGLLESMAQRIEYELKPVKIPMQNKVILAILEILALGCCGIDRCYMGETCMGVVKGLTLGGFGVWATVDYVIVGMNCLTSAPTIDYLGFRADFTSDSIKPAFKIVLLAWILMAMPCFCLPLHRFLAARDSSKIDDDKRALWFFIGSVCIFVGGSAFVWIARAPS